MPVKKFMMDALKKEYGAKKGESVYYAMEDKRKAKSKRTKKK